MSVTSYKAWLQNNGFVQSTEDPKVFTLIEEDPSKIGDLLNKALDKAKTLGINAAKGFYDNEPGIKVRG